ncbi:MAG: cytochrome P450 [Actinomycetota bacterium]
MLGASADARPDELSPSSLTFWAQPAAVRDAVFAELRARCPVSRQPPAEGTALPLPPDDPGYWAVVRHEDVCTVSRNAELFISAPGIAFEDVPAGIGERILSILMMDGARHHQVRRLVSAAFHPRQVARIEQQIEAQAKRIVDDLAPLGEGDFMERVARPLPTWTISEMIGIPEERRERAVGLIDAIANRHDPDFMGERTVLELVLDVSVELHRIGMELIEERRRQPTSDLMTALVQAEVEGERLTDEEIASFFVLLVGAGNETTRNTIGHTMKALSDHPDQRHWLMEDFDGRIDTAVEEFIRWATPIRAFRRTATAATDMAGQRIEPGDKVVLFYVSANRDEAVFADPGRFDLARQPNPHVAFGAGVHFCLGAALARTQLRAIFRQLLRRLPDIEVGEPVYLVSNFLNAIRSLPCGFTPEA